MIFATCHCGHCHEWPEDEVRWTDAELSTADSSEPASTASRSVILSYSLGALLMILASTDKIVQAWGR